MKLKFVAAIAALGLGPIASSYANQAYATEILTRDEAIARAIAAAPMLAASRETIAASRAGARQANIKPNPQLSAEFENFTGTGPFTGLGRSEVTFFYSQRLERGGKRRYRTKLADEEGRISVARWHINRLDIIWEAEQAYILALGAKAELKNLEKQARIVAEIERTIRVRVERGKDSKLAVQNARIRSLNAERRVTEAGQILAAAKLALASLWRKSGTDFRLDTSRLFDLPNFLQPADREQFLDGPDLQFWKLKQARTAANLTLEKARAVQDPTFTVGVRYLQNSSDVAAVAGVSIPFALHDTNKGNISKAKAQLNRSRFEFLEAERRLERRLVLQQKILTSSFAQVGQIREGLAETEKTKRLVLEQLEQGAVSYLDVFAVQTLAADFERQLIAELKRFQLAKAEIDRLTARRDVETVTADDGENNAYNDSEGQ